MKHPSRPGMKAFVPAETNGDHPPPPKRPTSVPKRPPEVNEAILDRATAKLEALSEHFEKMVKDVPTREDLEHVLREVRATRKVLDQHLADARVDRENAGIRHEALMGILGDILAGLPDTAARMRAKQTIPPPPLSPDSTSTETPSPSSPPEPHDP